MEMLTSALANFPFGEVLFCTGTSAIFKIFISLPNLTYRQSAEAKPKFSRGMLGRGGFAPPCFYAKRTFGEVQQKRRSRLAVCNTLRNGRRLNGGQIPARKIHKAFAWGRNASESAAAEYIQTQGDHFFLPEDRLCLLREYQRKPPTTLEPRRNRPEWTIRVKCGPAENNLRLTVSAPLIRKKRLILQNHGKPITECSQTHSMDNLSLHHTSINTWQIACRAGCGYDIAAIPSFCGITRS